MARLQYWHDRRNADAGGMTDPDGEFQLDHMWEVSYAREADDASGQQACRRLRLVGRGPEKILLEASDVGEARRWLDALNVELDEAKDAACRAPQGGRRR